MRYAQELRGQRLHLVRETDPDLTGRYVERRALCGRIPDRRGDWGMTINVPLANACKSCCRVLAAIRSRQR